MMIKQSSLSVCVVTTIFPDNLNFFQDFLDGLSCQTYWNFDLIIYNDGCNHDELVKKLHGFNFEIIERRAGSTFESHWHVTEKKLNYSFPFKDSNIKFKLEKKFMLKCKKVQIEV